MANRIDKLLKLMTAENQNFPMLVEKSRNIVYLTGYTGEGWLLVTASGSTIITDFRYTEQAAKQAPGVNVIMYDASHPMLEILRELLNNCGARKLALEEDAITVSRYRTMLTKLSGIELTNSNRLIEKLRAVKDEEELASIKKANEIASAAFVKLLDVLKPGMTEKEVQLELNYMMERMGGQAVAFNTIACAGANGSLPHAIPGDHKLQNGELLTLDFGTVYNNYCSDTTRTVAIGKISPELKQIYDTVLEAQKIALDLVKPGMCCFDIDKAARDFIDGHAQYKGTFGHGLGHGVGLDIHEAPSFNTRDKTILVPGHVMTVEPGIYIPGFGGCRIEDMGAITEDGFDNYVTAPKELITI